MTTSLNKRSYEFAQDQIKQRHVVLDQRDDWSEHQPSTKAENEFIGAHGWDEYANWHLGVDDEASEHTKARYKFPYGDFERVHPVRSERRRGPGRAAKVPRHRGRRRPPPGDDGQAEPLTAAPRRPADPASLDLWYRTDRVDASVTWWL